jgi:hypothetical protein
MACFICWPSSLCSLYDLLSLFFRSKDSPSCTAEKRRNLTLSLNYKHPTNSFADQKHGVIAGLKEKLKTLPTQPLNVEELICPNIEEERKKLLVKPVKPVATGKKK